MAENLVHDQKHFHNQRTTSSTHSLRPKIQQFHTFKYWCSSPLKKTLTTRGKVRHNKIQKYPRSERRENTDGWKTKGNIFFALIQLHHTMQHTSNRHRPSGTKSVRASSSSNFSKANHNSYSGNKFISLSPLFMLTVLKLILKIQLMPDKGAKRGSFSSFVKICLIYCSMQRLYLL